MIVGSSFAISALSMVYFEAGVNGDGLPPYVTLPITLQMRMHRHVFPTALHRLSDLYTLPYGWKSRWHEFDQPIYLQGMPSRLLHELSFCSPLFHSFG